MHAMRDTSRDMDTHIFRQKKPKKKKKKKEESNRKKNEMSKNQRKHQAAPN
jgi:hypothetical protein